MDRGEQKQFEFALGELDLLDEVGGVMAAGQVTGDFFQAGLDLAQAALAARLEHLQ